MACPVPVDSTLSLFTQTTIPRSSQDLSSFSPQLLCILFVPLPERPFFLWLRAALRSYSPSEDTGPPTAPCSS